MLIAIIALVIGAALYVVNMVGVNINANVICSLGVLIVGFAMLIKGADLFVEGASKIAAKFKIPQIVIGLTIVAMGTSNYSAVVHSLPNLAGESLQPEQKKLRLKKSPLF